MSDSTTPSSRWGADGQRDPHGDRYACERAALALGNLTDDELANAVFLHGNEQPTMADMAAGKALAGIVYLTAAKDRIRWLSRALADAIAPRPAKLAEQQGDAPDQSVIVPTLRAMVRNYSDGHRWDHLDARMCRAAADRIESLEAASAARQPGAQVPVAFMVRMRAEGGFGLVRLKDMPYYRPHANEYEIVPLYAAPPAQGIELGQVREIRIPARNNLDPISVFVQDQAAGRGRIVVTCYGNAWQAFWGAMGDRTVMEFVAQCDADYVAGNMISGRQTRMTKAERAYTERIATEVITEFRALRDGQRDASAEVTNA